nr:hypothetical protein CFP56_67946 [Quercus suber]POE70433.1 hypothetical protein CFP56_35587 [Quercus suber]
MGHRLEETNHRWQSLDAAGRSISMQQCSFARIRDHVDSAIGPAVAVIKVFDTAHELQMLLMPDPCSDLFDYLSIMKYKSCRLC